MEIAQARKQAAKHLESGLILSRAKRAPKGAAVMCRLPKDPTKLLTADTPEELTEKLAKRLQAAARRAH